MSEFDAIFFDLDGTLVDTAPDLAFALNTVMQEEGFSPLAYDKIRAVASNGSPGLLDLAFGIDTTHDDFERLQQRFIQIYQDNITRESTLFEGMLEFLDAIENQAKTWGVITNKPAFLTEPLLAALNLSHRAACIVSGDTTSKSKPDAEPMLHACQLAQVEPQRCLYVGDAKRDIDAGKNANMKTIAATYGYLGEHDDPHSWLADAIINHPSELHQWL